MVFDEFNEGPVDTMFEDATVVLVDGLPSIIVDCVVGIVFVVGGGVVVVVG